MNASTTRFTSITAALLGIFLLGNATARAASMAVPAGQLVTLTATADGTAPFTYQWYKDGNILNGFTNSTYILNSFQASDAGTYSTVISNSAGSTTSDTAVLTLSNPNIAPAFTTQPNSQTVTAGSSVTFTAAASGTPSPTFQWKKDGTNISGATSASYTLANVASGNAGSYTVVATNSVSSVISSAATLTVNPAPSAPVFITQPSSQSATEGGSVTFTAAASGTPSPTFQWRKNGANISGATSPFYTLSNVAIGNSGSYTVVATNSVSSVTSNAATLTVNPPLAAPSFLSQPSSQTVTAGASVTFTASASGNPSPSYQWKKNGTNISGATSTSYTLSNVASANAGSYTVVATNSVSAVTSNAATLTVNPAPEAPLFTTQPSSQTVTAGTSVTFTAAATGTPSPTFQWKKNGTNISGATSASYTISNVASANAGSYTVVATNSVSAVTSNAATLTVNPAPAAPAFTTQPSNQSATAGTSVTFTAAASGTPSPTFQWRKNGINIVGATNASYTLSSVTSGNAGSYTVIATNSVSAVTSNAATLTVNPAPAAPAFTTQPSSQSVIAGASVTLNAVASGTPSPTFQWKKDGVNISGATGTSYVIAVTSATDEGTYSVVATNSMGSVASEEAILSVATPPKNLVVTLVVQ